MLYYQEKSGKPGHDTDSLVIIAAEKGEGRKNMYVHM
jgi:hypothetical protein